MGDIVLTTFDWVPEPPRGFVRDIRVRWALEEAKLPYRVEGVPFHDRKEAHLAHQPFGQVPWLTDGDVSIFESGAILLHLGEKSDALMPTDPQKRAEVKEWIFAALNSVEMAGLPWGFLKWGGESNKFFDDFLKQRLDRLEPVLASREWVAGSFSVADIMLADVLRFIDRFEGLAAHSACRDYVARAKARPAFAKAHADQLAHFAAGDQKK